MKRDGATYRTYTITDIQTGQVLAHDMMPHEIIAAGIIDAPTPIRQTASGKSGVYKGRYKIEVCRVMTNAEYVAREYRKRGHIVPEYVVPYLYLLSAPKSSFTIKTLVQFCTLRERYATVRRGTDFVSETH